MTMLLRKIPDDIHRAFKVQCAMRRISMEQAVINLMEKAVENDKVSMELRGDKGKA